jgi:hypothetical protein
MGREKDRNDPIRFAHFSKLRTFISGTMSNIGKAGFLEFWHKGRILVKIFDFSEVDKSEKVENSVSKRPLLNPPCEIIFYIDT